MRLFLSTETQRSAAQVRVLEALSGVTGALEDLRRAELMAEKLLDEKSSALPLACALLQMAKAAADDAEAELAAAMDEHTDAFRRRTVTMEMVP